MNTQTEKMRRVTIGEHDKVLTSDELATIVSCMADLISTMEYVVTPGQASVIKDFNCVVIAKRLMRSLSGE